MSDKITFEVKTDSTEYGDGKTFVEYRILMLKGKRVVGVEKGPRRTTVNRTEAIIAANHRIVELQSHRLFAIRITHKDIKEGRGRDCYNCAIARALNRNKERMGFDKYDCDIRIEPYGAFRDVDGIVFCDEDSDLKLPPDKMPMVVSGYSDLCAESMEMWAMHFDSWDDSRYMSLKEWRQETDAESDEHPYGPSPGSFVLDLDAMQAVQE